MGEWWKGRGVVVAAGTPKKQTDPYYLHLMTKRATARGKKAPTPTKTKRNARKGNCAPPYVGS